ncbi:UDP-N-acetylmuramate dehydrogenase [Flavobacteriaceae bacterium]|nr:UDP-N-acetylmuramate dehydrogenase [Flavobacteriaceae bacterium]
MKTIEQHKSLKAYNTFGVECFCEYFTSVSTTKELRSALLNEDFSQRFILGGGSNLLLTKNLSGLCIHVNLKGIHIVEENDDLVIIEASAGENWHDFVLWTLDQGYGGLENLALIPGNIGTAPIQNIGAYGVELKDRFVNCTTLDTITATPHRFNLEEAVFGYRNSIFKTVLKGKHVITAVQFRLTKKNHILKTYYGVIQEELGSKVSSPKNIAEAVIKIRQRKLPDPKKIGNSGSFFKNPVVTEIQFQNLLQENPEMPHYRISDSEVKIPAGWIIDRLGYKGIKRGAAGVHEHQALVLVNHGNASGIEILTLAKEIQEKVLVNFKISLEIEVNIY